MLNSPTNSPTRDRSVHKDALERVDNWLNLLERRIYALLDTNDPESMTPAQREQAASRHLMLCHHLLQLRQEYAVSCEEEDKKAFIDALIGGTGKLTNVDDTPIQDGQ